MQRAAPIPHALQQSLSLQVTTPDDMTHALGILEERRVAAAKLAEAEASAAVAA